ncbi:MAG TPA: choice-of-anchor tandem repeat GloVer-containing protein, partial [Candidatus Baltobacteraceae bacterium]|nr:choice-of-anchor tandem repeat GloVer-containing protein [Candidatus Baltobacteraceae bacterium]
MKQSSKICMLRRAAAPLLAAAFLLAVRSEGAGLSVVNLHSFDVFLNGAVPYASLVQGANGLLYGTTFEGGIDNAGVVFEVASNGTMSALYTFTNGVDGGFPEAGLVLANDGNFYGTTYEGGTNGTGVVFKMTPAGGFSPLYSFTAIDKSGENQDGAYPSAGLIQATDGNLYGVTSTGGANGSGTLFKVSLGGSFGLVYTFSVVDIDGYNREGSAPQAALVQSTDGNFYGTADEGGSNGLGAVFEYVVSQSTVSPLYSFLGAGDGSKPLAALVQGSDGDFYGTASEGGTNGFGSVFKIASGGAFTPLYSFANGSDGGNPVASLVQGANGNFFGTSTGPQSGFGTVFEMTTNGALSTLYTFTGGDDGAYP